jgi:hypothetical protein
MTMADQRMSHAEYAAYQPYVEEIIALVNQHISRHPDPEILSDAWRIGYMTVLTEVVRAYRLLPDQRDSYLQRSLEALMEDTQTCIRNWDREGPPR